MKYILFILTMYSLTTYAQKGPCKKIKTITDKFTGEIRMYSPPGGYISYSKYIETDSSGHKDTSIYMSIIAYANTVNYNAEGLYFILSDSSRINLPSQKIKCSYKAGYYIGSTYFSGSYEYSAFLKLNAEMIDKLTRLDIFDYRLYIYDMNLTNDYMVNKAKKYKSYLRCLTGRPIIEDDNEDEE